MQKIRYNLSTTSTAYFCTLCLANKICTEIKHVSLMILNESLYVFSMYKIKLTDSNIEAWERVQVRGGKELDVRVVAHTAVYHSHSNSILIYGGVVASVARYAFNQILT